ncbi:unnamed protein product, partial [Prunus brigantina]
QCKLQWNLEKVRKWKALFRTQCLFCSFMLFHNFACFGCLAKFTLCTTVCFVY